MEPKTPPILFETPAKLRAWFAKHAAKETEVWLMYFKKGSGKQSVTYQEALDEALCVGWIDGQVRSIDAERYMQRWTPRRKGSYWSAVNIKKAERLIAEGRMKKAGLAAFEARDPAVQAKYSFEAQPEDLPPELLAKVKANKAAWTFWQAEPPGMRRTATWFVISAKKEETRARRIALLIERAAQGRRIPILDPLPSRKKAAKRAAKATKAARPAKPEARPRTAASRARASSTSRRPAGGRQPR